MELNFFLKAFVFLLCVLIFLLSSISIYLEGKEKIKKKTLENNFRIVGFGSLLAIFCFIFLLYCETHYPNKNQTCLQEERIEKILVKNYNNMNMVLTSDGVKRRFPIAEEGRRVCVKTQEEKAFYSISEGIHYRSIVTAH